MNKYIAPIMPLMLIVSVFSGCSTQSADNPASETPEEQSEAGDPEEGHEEEAMGVVHFSELKFNSLGIKVDTIPTRPLAGVVEANGQLEVPPQHEATVTAILGANVTSIKVIEGDQVKKGHVLAYLSHPNLTRLQTDYIQAYQQLQFLEQENKRQQRLYEEEVGSGKTYQQTRADYQSMRGQVKGYEAQLKQLGLRVNKLQAGDIYEYVPAVSPIDGYVEKVMIQVGQYVDPQTEMFALVNTEHVHADLMVFEKDVYRVKEGQRVIFTVASVPGNTLSAEIYSVGKQFEQNPKAVHVHAEIDKKEDFLIPGMYINGKIHTESESVQALPEAAIIEEEGKPYIFTAEAHEEDGQTEWEFSPVEIRTGTTDEGWVEINLLEPLPEGTLVAWNNAYYLVSEMQKSQTSHGH